MMFSEDEDLSSKLFLGKHVAFGGGGGGGVAKPLKLS